MEVNERKETLAMDYIRTHSTSGALCKHLRWPGHLVVGGGFVSSGKHENLPCSHDRAGVPFTLSAAGDEKTKHNMFEGYRRDSLVS